MSNLIFTIFFMANLSSLAAIEYQVFFVAGQSNAVGVADKEPLLNDVFPNYFLSTPKDFVQVYHILNQRLEPLTLGLNHNSNTNWISHGPEVGFLQYLFDHEHVSSDKPALLFKYAYGGTSLAIDWNVNNPDSHYYSLINHYKNFLDIIYLNGDTVSPKALLWIQGESDGGEKSKKYGDRLYTFIRQFRYDILKQTNIKKAFPVISARMKNNKTLDQQQDKVENRDGHFATIPSKGLSLSEDGIHYDTQGLWDMGLRLGEKYLKMERSNSSSKLYLDLLPYPNPVKHTETLRIRTRQSLKCEYVQINLLDILGRKIHSTQIEQIELNEVGLDLSLVRFQLSYLASSVYFINAKYQSCGEENISGVITKQFVVNF
ncbi:sialate O-acetylesterase [Bacteriovoracaceae bacterium]|nr:sialate O-acetylesterase [Bacteriovoracaceae bacterium]